MVKTLSNLKIHIKTPDTWKVVMFPFSRTLTAFPSVVKYFSTYVTVHLSTT
jgi:hypothetical protein